MEWIDDYDLFLFDFDGLLVDTERLHYLAYQKMCRDRGFHLEWDFTRYIRAAHYSHEGLKEEIYAELPALRESEPDWSVLYKEKRQALFSIYGEVPIPLMKGVEKLLGTLEARRKKRCVVTHSDRRSVAMIREKNPSLEMIPHWIVREDYDLPKPAPDGYLRAIELFAEEGDRIIGFEDTPKGLKALMGTSARAVMVTEMHYPEMEALAARGIAIFPNFVAIGDECKK